MAQRDAHESPRPTLGGIITSTVRRAGIIAATALVLITGAPLATEPATTTTPSTATSSAASQVTNLLALRTERAAAATRATRTVAAAPVKRITVAQRRAQINAAKRAAVVKFANAQVGKWYRLGARGMARFDCSGLTLRAFQKANLRMPHSSRAQRSWGIRVSSKNARPGDLVSYNGHVGILVGKWTMVDAPGTGRKVTKRKIFKRGDLQFRRVIR